MKYARGFLLAFVCIINISIFAQDDTLYFYKKGIQISKHATVNIDSIIFYKAANDSSVSDFEGNIYNTVTIGKQRWLAENLRSTIYNDGTPIQKITADTVWENCTVPAYCWFHNDSTTYYNNLYGALYNFYAVETGKLCPQGWHIPASAEWDTLISYLDLNFNYDDHIGTDKYALAIADTLYWQIKSYNGCVGNADYIEKRNMTGFSALPAASRLTSGEFGNINQSAHWWSSTQYSSERAYYYIIRYFDTDVDLVEAKKESGTSIRCIQD